MRDDATQPTCREANESLAPPDPNEALVHQPRPLGSTPFPWEAASPVSGHSNSEAVRSPRRPPTTPRTPRRATSPHTPSATGDSCRLAPRARTPTQFVPRDSTHWFSHLLIGTCSWGEVQQKRRPKSRSSRLPTAVLPLPNSTKPSLAIDLCLTLAKLRNLRNILHSLSDEFFSCDRKNPQVLPRLEPKTYLSDDFIVFELQGFNRCPSSVYTQLSGSS